MALTKIAEQTASNSASLSFTSDIDSTYKLYMFKFVKINPATDGTQFSFQADVSGASGYNETILSSYFRAYHTESGGGGNLQYESTYDQSGTAFQTLNGVTGNDSDAACDGELFLYNPSNTTYIKHFQGRLSSDQGDAARDSYAAGYFDVTGAITQVQFKMASGNFDGIISMWGL
jgi:hypothetical protein